MITHRFVSYQNIATILPSEKGRTLLYIILVSPREQAIALFVVCIPSLQAAFGGNWQHPLEPSLVSTWAGKRKR
jgi:hypothetical protein